MSIRRKRQYLVYLWYLDEAGKFVRPPFEIFVRATSPEEAKRAAVHVAFKTYPQLDRLHVRGCYQSRRTGKHRGATVHPEAPAKVLDNYVPTPGIGENLPLEILEQNLNSIEWYHRPKASPPNELVYRTRTPEEYAKFRESMIEKSVRERPVAED